jgi:hypothetical protein
MITLRSQLFVDGVRGNEIVDFLLTCTDQAYQAWWPGTHLQLHTLVRCPNNVGNIVFMDEFIGKRRIKMIGVVRVAEPTRLVWQLKKGILLPVWLTLELAEDAAGVTLTHTIRAGFDGLGQFFDPLFRLYFSEAFGRALDEHVKTEFPKLRDLLRRLGHAAPLAVKA